MLTATTVATRAEHTRAGATGSSGCARPCRPRPDRARNPGAAEATIAAWILGKILLVVVLGEIEFGRVDDLGGDGAVTPLVELLLIDRLGCQGRLFLFRGEDVDRGTVLRADVVALPHALRRVVTFPECFEQRLVGNCLRIIDHQHTFGVAGAPAANFFIGRIGREAADITDSRDDNARAEFPEFAFGAPETSEREDGLGGSRRVRPFERAMIDEMLRRCRDRHGAAGQCLGAARKDKLFEPEHRTPSRYSHQYRSARGKTKRGSRPPTEDDPMRIVSLPARALQRPGRRASRARSRSAAFCGARAAAERSQGGQATEMPARRARQA